MIERLEEEETPTFHLPAVNNTPLVCQPLDPAELKRRTEEAKKEAKKKEAKKRKSSSAHSPHPL